MLDNYDEFLSAALSLPPNERAMVAERLLKFEPSLGLLEQLVQSLEVTSK
jgi:hypothetical protein